MIAWGRLAYSPYIATSRVGLYILRHPKLKKQYEHTQTGSIPPSIVRKTRAMTRGGAVK